MSNAVLFLANGFEECEAFIVVDIVRRAGIKIVMASITGGFEVESSRGIIVKADDIAENVDYRDVELIVLPGGRRGVENLKKSEFVKEKCIDFAKNGRIAAICAAPTILASMGILEGVYATCHPDFEKLMSNAIITHEDVTIAENIITGQGLGATFDFALEIVRQFKGNECVDKIINDICYQTRGRTKYVR